MAQCRTAAWPTSDDLSADYTDTYVRYRSGDTRLTLGAQTIIWGRVDEIPLADRVSRTDLTRFVLDDLPDRRRARTGRALGANHRRLQTGCRMAAAVQGSRTARRIQRLEPDQSHHRRDYRHCAQPGSRRTGGNCATISEDEHGSGGGGVRLTKTGEPFDFGITLARTRQSQPYYLIGGTPAAPTLTGIHPFNNFAGADMEMESARHHLAHGTGLHR